MSRRWSEIARQTVQRFARRFYVDYGRGCNNLVPPIVSKRHLAVLAQDGGRWGSFPKNAYNMG
jgi:hypothetical protein